MNTEIEQKLERKEVSTKKPVKRLKPKPHQIFSLRKKPIALKRKK